MSHFELKMLYRHMVDYRKLYRYEQLIFSRYCLVPVVMNEPHSFVLPLFIYDTFK